MPDLKTTLVVPCYNEEHRLSDEAVLALLEDSAVSVMLVDDGSSDATLNRLEALRERVPDRVSVLGIPVNGGKAEAVRAGLLRAIETGADVVGYADADFSTPPAEILRLVDMMRRGNASAIIGSRVARLGAHIERRATRHYLGRVFATVASLSLGRPVYDTQCGAKLFRASAALRDALESPFRSRWAFDVELLGRFFRAESEGRSSGGNGVIEAPLREWRDKAGSKLQVGGMARAGMDLFLIAADLRRRRDR